MLSPEQLFQMEKRNSGPLLKDGQDLTVDVSKLPKGPNNAAWVTPKYEVLGNDYNVFQLKISDSGATRYTVPDEVVSLKKGNSYTHTLETYGVSVTTDPTFSLEMHDVRDPTNWFIKTQGEAAFFYDKYVEFGFRLPSQRIYGFGERSRSFGLTEGAWQMWARNGDDTFDDGSSGL